MMRGGDLGREALRVVGRALGAGLAAAVRELSRRTPSPGPRPAPSPAGYAGDATGPLTLEYAPFDDDDADPGEIVWAWVPYEEDHTRGKDRPVLVVGRQQGFLLALMLTSKDHDRDAADEARHGRFWVDIGTGEWDRQRRPSEVRVDRVLRIRPAAVRREGAVLDPGAVRLGGGGRHGGAALSGTAKTATGGYGTNRPVEDQRAAGIADDEPLAGAGTGRGDHMADVVDLIKLQHRRMDDLLEKAQQAGPDQIPGLLRQVAELLLPHSEAEESFVYPAIQQYDRGEAEEVKDGTAEHHHVEELMKQLLAEDPFSPGYDGKLAAMAGELRHHVEEEEQELLPVLSGQASDDERDELGARFAEVTGHQLEDEADGTAKPGKAAKDDAGGGSSSGRTRDELYQQAKEKDIPGRSSMSKDELARAVDAAQ